MRSLNRILDFDAATGVITAEAGVLLSDIIAHAAPHGFFPPVVPGTQFVTLGGAIANDVHGKNHHRRGTFGCHVERIDTPHVGRTQTHPAAHLRPTRDSISATIGGMGLTGIILSASLRLMRVPSLDIIEKTVPFDSLAQYFEQAEAADRENEYAVAWIDQLAAGRRAGRGLLISGNHAKQGARHGRHGRQGGSSVPFQPPLNVLNRPFLTAFNAAYRWRRGRDLSAHRIGISGLLLSARRRNELEQALWPEGPVPASERDPVRGSCRNHSGHARGCAHGGAGFLPDCAETVRQAIASPGLLSFPRPGYTLTLDFPNRGARTLALLGELDAITVAAGGAVNPYKDARMSAETFAASFPAWPQMEAMRDPAFLSRFWARTAMRLGNRDQGLARAAE
jgi:FAD/FMN-containing dehydrogenase